MDEQEQGAGRYLWALEFSIVVGIDPWGEEFLAGIISPPSFWNVWIFNIAVNDPIFPFFPAKTKSLRHMYNVILYRQPARAHVPRPGYPGVWG